MQRARTAHPAKSPDYPQSVERLAVTIPDAMAMLGVGRSTIYGLMGSAQINARKIGRRTLITTSSIRALLEALPAAEIAAPKNLAR